MQSLKVVTSMVAAIVMSANLAAQTIQINRENKTIAISTIDEATATADIAAVTVGFELYGAKAEDTYRQAEPYLRRYLLRCARSASTTKTLRARSRGC